MCSVGQRLVCSRGKERRWGGHREIRLLDFLHQTCTECLLYVLNIKKDTVAASLSSSWIGATLALPENFLHFPVDKVLQISCHLVVNVEKNSKAVFPTPLVIITILNCLTFNYREISVCFYFIPNLSYILRSDKKSLIQN